MATQPEQLEQFNEHKPTSDIQGILAPNVKPARLQEVEDDATFIQTRRFRDQFDEHQREAEKNAAKEKKGDK